jgi:hypothetical protein
MTLATSWLISFSQPQQHGPLLRGGNNALVVDPVIQHPDLEHQQLSGMEGGC